VAVKRGLAVPSTSNLQNQCKLNLFCVYSFHLKGLRDPVPPPPPEVLK
jgi:hypothetical protein